MGATVILGAAGRLGAALAREWRAAGEEVIAFDRKSLNLAEPKALNRALCDLDFDVVVNCAALTNVDYCEKNRDEAFRINAEAPAALATLCQKRGVRCIHISTDYVFDGLAKQPYRETDPANPISVYGESKLAGEQAVIAVGPKHWSVRVSWVFGPDRASFVDNLIVKAMKEEQVSAIADKWATPTYTLHAAKMLRPFLRKVGGGGLLHLSNGGECSWQEFGQWALECAAKAGVPLKTQTVEPMSMKDLKAFVAKRPPYTPMDTSKISDITGMVPRGWKDAVMAHVNSQAALGVWKA